MRFGDLERRCDCISPSCPRPHDLWQTARGSAPPRLGHDLRSSHALLLGSPDHQAHAEFLCIFWQCVTRVADGPRSSHPRHTRRRAICHCTPFLKAPTPRAEGTGTPNRRRQTMNEWFWALCKFSQCHLFVWRGLSLGQTPTGHREMTSVLVLRTRTPQTLGHWPFVPTAWLACPAA